MPQSDMHIHVSVPGFNTLTDPVKSLINFFLKDSKFYFRGDYTDSTLNALYGCIRTTYKSIVELSGDTDGFISQDAIELYIPYTMDTASSSATYPVRVDGQNDIPKFPVSLIEKESRLRLYWLENDTEEIDGDTIYFRQANVYHSSESVVEAISPIENVRVILTPKIGSATATNPDASIDAITSSNPNMSLNITASHELESDYQLRTSCLFLSDGSSNFAENVYYKVGLVPFDKQYAKWGSGSPTNTPTTLASLKSIILTDRFSVSADSSYMVGSGTYMYLAGTAYAVGEPWESDDDFWDSVPPLSVIIPIKNDSEKFIGLMYARLCKQDGSEITRSEIEGLDLKFYYKSSEDDPNPILIESSGGLSNVAMIFTDQNISGGWVQTPES